MTETLALTDLQIEIMRVLWERGEATVVDVHREVGQSRNLAQPTIATLLSRLEKKGAISHRTEGRQFVYRPAVAETAVRRSMIAQLTDRLFTGDVPALISHLLADRNVSAEDLAKVKKLIAAKEQDLKDSGDASGTP